MDSGIGQIRNSSVSQSENSSRSENRRGDSREPVTAIPEASKNELMGLFGSTGSGRSGTADQGGGRAELGGGRYGYEGGTPGMGGGMPGMGGGMPGMGGDMPGMGGGMPGMGGDMPGMGGGMSGMGGGMSGMGGGMSGMGGGMSGMGGGMPGMGGGMPGMRSGMPGYGRSMVETGGGIPALPATGNEMGGRSGRIPAMSRSIQGGGELSEMEMQQLRAQGGFGTDLTGSGRSNNGNNSDVSDFIGQLLEYETMKAIQCTDTIAPGMNTVIIIDTSASMAGLPIQTAVNVIKDILKGIEHCAIEYDLEENVSVISFGSENHIAQHLTNDFSKVLDVLDTFEATGPSALYLAIVLSLISVKRALAPQHDSPKPRIIIISDYNATKPTPFCENVADLPESQEQKIQNKMHIMSCVQNIFDEYKIKFYFVPVGTFDEVLPEFLADAIGGKIVTPTAAKWLGRSHLHHSIAAGMNKSIGEITHDIVKETARQTIAQDDLFDQDIQEIISICKESGIENFTAAQSSLVDMPRPSSFDPQRTQTGGSTRIPSMSSNQTGSINQLVQSLSQRNSNVTGPTSQTFPGSQAGSQQLSTYSQANIPQLSTNSQANIPQLSTRSEASSQLLSSSQVGNLPLLTVSQASSLLVPADSQTYNLSMSTDSQAISQPVPTVLQEPNEEITAEQVMKQLMEFYIPPDTSNLPIMPDLATKVKKGPDWLKLYDRNVPDDEIGEVIKCYGDDQQGWVRVKWLNKRFEEDYRYGLESDFDVVPLGGIEVVKWREGQSYKKKPSEWEITDSSDNEDTDLENTSQRQRDGDQAGSSLLPPNSHDTQEIQNDFDAPADESVIEEASAIPNRQGHFVWQFTNDHGDWTSYYPDIQQQLETSFQQKPKRTVLIKYGLQTERISFSHMKQRNTQTGKERPVRRLEIDLEQFQQIMNFNDT